MHVFKERCRYHDLRMHRAHVILIGHMARNAAWIPFYASLFRRIDACIIFADVVMQTRIMNMQNVFDACMCCNMEASPLIQWNHVKKFFRISTP